MVIDTASSFLGEYGVAEKDRVEIIIGMWAVVHGITEIATMKGVIYSLVSLLLGWWGIPWDPIYTVGAVIKICSSLI